MDSSDYSIESLFKAKDLYRLSSMFKQNHNNTLIKNKKIYKLLDLHIDTLLNKNQLRLELMNKCPIFRYVTKNYLSFQQYADLLNIQLNMSGKSSCECHGSSNNNSDEYCEKCIKQCLTGWSNSVLTKIAGSLINYTIIELNFKYDDGLHAGKFHNDIFNSESVNYSESLLDLHKIFTLDGKISSEACDITTFRLDLSESRFYVNNFFIPYDIRISSLYWLKELFLVGRCNEIRLTDTVNLKNFSQLEVLVFCDNDMIMEITVPRRIYNGIPINNIKFLDIRNCGIRHIDMEPFTNLISANLSENCIDYICLDTCIKLQHLAICKNRLSSLDISKCKELKTLYAFNNEIKCIYIYYIVILNILT